MAEGLSRRRKFSLLVSAVAMHGALVAALLLASLGLEKVSVPDESMRSAAAPSPWLGPKKREPLAHSAGTPSRPEDSRPRRRRLRRSRGSGHSGADESALAVAIASDEEAGAPGDADASGEAGPEHMASGGAATGQGAGPGGGRAVSAPVPLGDYARFKVPWTEEARRRGISGAIVVRLRVAASGAVVATSLIRGLGHGLDERAIALARKFRFRPARDAGGIAVAVNVDWSFHVAD